MSFRAPHILALAALAQTACTAAVAVPVGETFTLAVGASESFEGADLVLTFDGVRSDNRCPPTVQCIVAGAARVVLEAERGDGDPTELVFAVPPGGSAAERLGDLLITITEVEPETHPARRIEPEEYVVTGVVERTPETADH